MPVPKWFELIEDNWIYIYHSNAGDGEYVLLPSWPDQLRDQLSSTFSSTHPLSRSAPIYSYSYSGPRTVDIQLDLRRDMIDLCNINVSNLNIDNLNDDYVDTIIKRLQSIAVPKYDAATSAVQPPMVALRFGNEVFIKGVVTGSISVSYNKPIITGKKYAEVSIGFSVVETDPYSYETIRDTGSFRGICSRFAGPFN